MSGVHVPWRFRGAANAAFGGITALEFDRTCDLLWLGDSYGNIMSFAPVQPATEEVGWSTYSAFRPFGEVACQHIQFLNNGQETLVAFAANNRLRVTKRGGTTVLNSEIPNHIQRRITYFQTDFKSGAMYVAGDTSGVQMVALEAPGDWVTSSTVEGATTALRFGEQWLAVGSSTGHVLLKDIRTLETMHNFKPFASRVTAIAGDGVHMWAASAERSVTSTVVKIFDTRNMSEPVTTISGIHGGSVAALRVYHDKAANAERAMLVTPQGFHQLQLDCSAPVFSSVGIEGGSCTTGAVTRNGIGAVLGNDKGYLLALSSTSHGDTFSNHDHPHPAPQPKSSNDHHVWSQSSSNRGQLDSGFDYDVPEVDLASSWPKPNYMILAAEGKLRNMNLRIAPGQAMVNTWGLTRADLYVTDPKDKVSLVIPNPYPYNDDLGDDPSKVQQLLQELRKCKRSAIRAKGDTNGLYAKQEEALQACYGNTSQTQFNWAAYNSSREVVGVDNSQPESWISPLLQSLYLCHAPYYPVRKALVHHVCKKEYCVTCEVAIMFANMMTISATGGAPVVQCASLIRTMYQIPEFVESGVFLPSQDREHAVAKMHRAQKLLFEAFDRDLRCAEYRFEGSAADGSAGVDMENLMVSYFGTEFQSMRNYIPPRFYWEVPASATKVDEGLQHLLKQLESYNGDQVQIKRLPPIIVLLLNPEHGSLKPPTSLKFSRPPKEEFNYVLCSNVLHLADDADDPGLFCSHHQTGDRENFVLINDYLVSAPQPEELLEAAIPATTPHSVVVTCYALDTFRAPRFLTKDGSGLLTTERPNMFEILGPLLLDDVLAQPLTALRSPNAPPLTPLPATISSVTDIKSGDLVAVDAEYVVLAWANKRPDEPDWIRRQRKPHMSLARVSCILSSRDGDERTIIDDYVHTPEEVLDYVSQYSGIHEGDLDPRRTEQRLTTLKATQFKLRALVDRGVKFVGHGLPQDFRVCNIAVPPHQVIDTLELFHRHGHRKLSLRFLAYVVLGERVQEDEHDSVEDARTSLRLYRKYEEAMTLGVFDTLMDHVLTRGIESNWYVPGECVTAESSATKPRLHHHHRASGHADDDGARTAGDNASNSEIATTCSNDRTPSFLPQEPEYPLEEFADDDATVPETERSDLRNDFTDRDDAGCEEAADDVDDNSTQDDAADDDNDERNTQATTDSTNDGYDEGRLILDESPLLE